MMTFTDVINAIATVGFPIAACVYMFFELHNANSRREEELKSLRQILTDNTNTLRELVEYLKDET